MFLRQPRLFVPAISSIFRDFGSSIPKYSLGRSWRRRSVFDGRSGCRFRRIVCTIIMRSTTTARLRLTASLLAARLRFAAALRLAAGLRLAARFRLTAAFTTLTAAAFTGLATATLTWFTAAAFTGLTATTLTGLTAVATAIEQQSGTRILSAEHDGHRGHTDQT